MANWYYLKDGAEIGPLSPDALIRCVEANIVTPSTMIRLDDSMDWEPARNFKWLYQPVARRTEPVESVEFHEVRSEMRPCRGCQTMLHYSARACPLCGAVIRSESKSSDDSKVQAGLAIACFVALFISMLLGKDVFPWVLLNSISGAGACSLVGGVLKKNGITSVLIGTFFGPFLGVIVCCFLPTESE